MSGHQILICLKKKKASELKSQANEVQSRPLDDHIPKCESQQTRIETECLNSTKKIRQSEEKTV